MNFSDLNLSKQLLNALNDLEYTTPTPIQSKGFPVIMSGKDVLGIAQTGTGKTLAYLLPSLRQWQFSKSRFPQILILVPTRELVAQVVEETEKLTKYMNVVTVGVYGGANIRTQAEQMRDGLDIIVATPGRLLDLALRGDLVLKGIKKLIIDEVDETLNLGFRHQLLSIFDILPTKKQSLMFSATISEEVEALLNDYFIAPTKIEAARTGTPLENIEQRLYHVPNFFTKVNFLDYLLANDLEITKALIFASTKKLADQLAEQLEEKYPDAIGVIHSNKSQNNRFGTVQKFNTGEISVLIATDLVSRGIDISEVTHVINFDTPEVPENYIHRIGRTGRADKNGISITFTTQHEENLKVAIEEYMQTKIPVFDLPADLEISTVLTLDEQPKMDMPNVLVKLPKREDVGPAFHEKSAKNSKVNVRKDWKKMKMDKYGKPIKKGQKR
jgi:ATP-dependent RNA helicase RhlE